MSKLLRKIMMVVMMGILSTGAFAQGRDKDKRPPKDPVKVIDGKGGGGGSNRPPQPPPPKPKDGKKKP